MFGLKHAIVALCALAATVVQAEAANKATVYPAKSGKADANTVIIYSSLDEAISVPLIRAFQDVYPDIAVSYLEAQTIDIYDRIIQETDRGEGTADLAFSSAMDLQVKLANDGYARTVGVAAGFNWPKWANWRNSAFALTYEPAVIVYHKPSFAGAAPPATRGELIRFLRERGNDIHGRVGTYDIERAGVGFLFLARDLEHYRDIWDLVRAMGAAGVKLYSTSSAILERVSDGRFVIGYNILGSYAAEWAKSHPDLGIVKPRDYTVVMSRIAIVPSAARSPELGARFLEFLMSREGQEVLARDVGLAAIHPEVEDKNTAVALEKELAGQLRPVPVTPGLVVYLDQVKRSRLIRQWNEMLRGR